MNAARQHSFVPCLAPRDRFRALMAEVTHSLDPQQVSKEALGLLKRPRCGHVGSAVRGMPSV